MLLNLLKSTYYDFKSIFVLQKVRYKITGSCNKCGKCCRDIRFKYQYTEKEFELAKFLYPVYRRLKIRSITPEEGMILECTLLNEDGTCSKYIVISKEPFPIIFVGVRFRQGKIRKDG